jgi:hypothetical protein
MSRLALGFAFVAGLNIAVLWAVELRHRGRAKVSMLAVVGLAFLVSIALHLIALALRGVEFAFAWGMLTVPLVWLLGCLANLVAKFGQERRVSDRV